MLDGRAEASRFVWKEKEPTSLVERVSSSQTGMRCTCTGKD